MQCKDCEYDCRWCEIYNSGEKLRHYMVREKEEPEKTKEAAINYLKTLPLTNKEWLATLSAEDFYKEFKKAEEEGLMWTSTSGYVIKWLDEERSNTRNEMTLNGAINELQNLRDAEDMPIYYKPVFNAVIETISTDIKELYSSGFKDGCKHITELIIDMLKDKLRE